MSFLKKNWRFTVPAVVVLCVLLVGIVTLYSTSEPPESKRVYVMPEHSTDNPPSINTGEVPIARVPGDEDSVTIASASTEIASDTESLEACCPDQQQDTTVGQDPSSDLTDDEAIMRAYKEHLANGTLPHVPRAYDNEHLALIQAYETQLAQDAQRAPELANHTKQIQSLAKDLFATLTPEERQKAIATAAAQLKILGIDVQNGVLEDMVSGGHYNRTQEEIVSEFTTLSELTNGGHDK